MSVSLFEIRRAAVDHVRAEVENGYLDLADVEAVETYCTETADGHHDVIYTYAVRELFARGDLDAYLDSGDVAEWIGDDFDSSVTVDGQLTVAAFLAVRDAYSDAVALVRSNSHTTA